MARGGQPLPLGLAGGPAGSSGLAAETVFAERSFVLVPPRSMRRRFPIFRSYLCLRNARTECAGMADDTAQDGTLETQENSVTCYRRPLPAITYFRASAFCGAFACQSIRLNTQAGDISPDRGDIPGNPCLRDPCQRRQRGMAALE